MEVSKITKSPLVLHSFVVIIALLFTISFINLTARSLFGSNKDSTNIPNFIFDRDIAINWTRVCPILQNNSIIGHAMKWRLSPCHNKTLVTWHIPWTNAWTWAHFDKNAELRKERLREKEARKLEKLRHAEEENEANDTLAEGTSNEPPKETKTESTDHQQKEKSSNVVYTVLTGLVISSAILACIEVLHEKFVNKTVVEEKDQARRCSLAEFTINRHMRKESQERQAAFDEPKKVKPFLHQGSLDRAISILTPQVMKRLPRQSSVPARLTGGAIGAEGATPAGALLARKLSVDTSEDECSPAMKRRSRHFIRRH